ncbi:MAG: SOS response-associated peptidase family protein [Sterolibacterium sp.]|nr:SOS response-associated peptidase family protein [Sterolibacterium sp.]
MCGRFALTSSPEELTRAIGLAACPDLAPRANIAPATAIAVVRRSPAGAPVLHLLRCGLVSHWSQDPARVHPVHHRHQPGKR